MRRYGAYVKRDKLNAYVEATLKDDERGDPLVTAEGLKFLASCLLSSLNRLRQIHEE